MPESREFIGSPYFHVSRQGRGASLDSFWIEKNFSKIVRTKDKATKNATKNDPQPPSDFLGPTETILNFNPTEESKQNTRSIM